MNTNILKESSKGTQEITIESYMMKQRELFLTDSITAQSASDLIKQLMFLEKENPLEEIKLYINSPGGEVKSGLAIYDYMMSMHTPITTICIGSAASMASILFLAGKQRMIYSHSEIMMHDPSFNSFNIGGMKAHEIMEKVRSLQQTSEKLTNLIRKHTNLSDEQIHDITLQDTYFSAEEALKYGIATKIIK